MPGDKAPQVSVKTGLGPSSFKRLPSFRAPRDLKLSEFREIPPNPLNEGRTKKVFVPNLNVQRKKANDDKDSSNQNNDSSKSSLRDKGKQDRGRGRGRRNTNFVQNSGVFSEGLAPTLKSSGWRSKATEPSTSIPKPKLKLAENVKIDKEEEELVMKELMRDDFIEDPELEPDADSCPIQLPLQNCKLNLLKSEEPIVNKTENVVLPNGVKIKQEPGEFNSFQMNGIVEEKPFDIQQMRPLSIPQLLARSSDKNFIFFQIPTCVPRLKLNVSQPAKKNVQKPEESEATDKYVLRTLPPGRIGTLKIRKSGSACLFLGDVKLSVEPGTQAAFKQDLISVNLDNDTKTGNMVNLGSLTTRMIITPEWESLLKKQHH